MSLLRFHTLDVFTRELFAGNPLAVVLGGDALDRTQMQTIAREFKFSETVFVLPAEDSTAMLRLRIFTPVEELPFAGHPIIGSACLLAEKGLVPPGNEVQFPLETGLGVVPVRITRTPGEAVFSEVSAARLPERDPRSPVTTDLAAALSLDIAAIGHHDEQPLQVSCGLPVLLVPLRAPEHLAAIEADFRALSPILASCGAHSVYVYARGYEGELRARMFSPGIGEDPATGAAALALGGRLALEQADDGETTWTVRQGVEMGRPSELRVTAERRGGQVARVSVGGHAVQVMEGHLETGG